MTRFSDIQATAKTIQATTGLTQRQALAKAIAIYQAANIPIHQGGNKPS